MTPGPSLLVRSLAGAALIGAAPLFLATAAEAPLRELTTDRPDTTESPFTIDPGHVQVETTLVGYARGRRVDGVRPEAYEFATTNVRIGLTRAFEIDVGLAPIGVVEPGGRASRTGTGALALRAKLNLWGNDGGGTALALLPFIEIPLDRAAGIGPDDVEFGALVPLAIDLGGGLGLGLNGGIAVRRTAPAAGYRAFGIATAALSVPLGETVGSYFEVAAEFGPGETATSLNSGLTWLVHDNLQLDAGVQFGVSGDADAFAPFTGFSIRF